MDNAETYCDSARPPRSHLRCSDIGFNITEEIVAGFEFAKSLQI